MNQEQVAAAMANMQRLMAAGTFPSAVQGGVPGGSRRLLCLCL